MESIMTKAMEWIPPGWRPYVAFLLIALYVATKVRSMMKSAELEKRCKTCPASQLVSKILVNRVIDKPSSEPEPPRNVMRKVIDIIF